MGIQRLGVGTYDHFVKYVAHGYAVDGHQFGFIKKSGDCDNNILWISVSTHGYDLQDLKDLEGTNATIQIKIDETQFKAKVDLLAVSSVTSSLSMIAFTNFLAGEKFIAHLKRGKKAEITVLAPEKLLNKLDIKTDAFSLEGFTASRLKAQEFCESQAVPSAGNADTFAISAKAEQGDAVAQTLLGRLYLEGKGVPRNLNEAAKWFKKAADQGDDDAQTLLGIMCLAADGVSEDSIEPSVMLKKAAELFEKAAEQGNDSAQYRLGLMYFSGKGIPQNKIKAYEWYMKSARQGNTKAQDALDILCKESSWACK